MRVHDGLVKMLWIGGLLVLAGAVAWATGVVSGPIVADTVERAWPVLVFVIAITVVAELAAAAGVFEAAAARLGAAARGSVLALWLLVVLLAVVCTAFLSLDTTAVLLTPVVLSLARTLGIAPLPFAITTVWLANTASLALPVSNLTNLLAAGRLDLHGSGDFVGLLGLPALCAIAATAVLLWTLNRGGLRGRYSVPRTRRVVDRPLLLLSSAIVVVLIPFLVLAPAPWVPALCAASALVLLFRIRRPAALRPGLVPWPLLVFASGLFLMAGVIEASGALAWLGPALGSGPGNVWGFAGTGVIGANAINNLPAYLLLEPAASNRSSLAALLIGVNVGPLITPWASLATLLWHQRLIADGVVFSWAQYVRWGVIAAPLVTAAAVLPLFLAG
ncbi:arsenic transporter [Leucobacter sp. Ag1]|nr:arsenic transporter [Leucobacter sp. Ag1]